MFFKHTTQQNLINRFGHESLIAGDIVLTFGGGGAMGFNRQLEILNLNTNAIKTIDLDLLKYNEYDADNDDYADSFLASFKMTYIDNINQVLIFGGINRTKQFNNNLMLLLNLETLKIIQATGDVPSPRIGHSFTKINNQKVILFGGVANSLANPNFCNDVYILHLNLHNNVQARWEKILIERKPSPRESHSAALYGNFIVIFGGMNGKQRLNDTWMFDINTHLFDKAKCFTDCCTPVGRSLHTATISSDSMYVFGGFVRSDKNKNKWTCTNSLQCLNLDTMTWKDIDNVENSRPEPRASHSAFEHHGRIYFCSGRKDLSMTKEIDQNGDCWFFETRVPTPVSKFQILFAGYNTILIKFSKSFNAVCYLIEIQEPPQHDKAPKVVEMEIDEPPSTILVRKINKNEAVEGPARKKIVIHEHKVLNLLNSPNVRKISNLACKLLNNYFFRPLLKLFSLTAVTMKRSQKQNRLIQKIVVLMEDGAL